MKKIIGEFKEFISRGNVVDMAVGVIIGGAFTAIVNSLVDDLVNPLLGLVTGGLDFASISVSFKDAEFRFGSFISAVINFLLVALVLFLLVKGINKFRRKKDEPEAPAAPATKVCPYCRSEIDAGATRCPHCTSQLNDPPGEK